MPLLEFADAFVDVFQSQRIRIPHRSAAIGGETISIEINDVDINGPKGKAVFKDSGPFIDEGIDTPIDDLARTDLALRNTRVGDPLANPPCDQRIWSRAALRLR